MRNATVLCAVLAMSLLCQAQEITTTHGDGTRLGTIDATNGAGTDVGSFGFYGTWAAAWDTDGTLYTIVNGFGGFNAYTLATVDTSSGAPTLIGSVGVPMIAIEIDCDGNMYGVGYTNRVLYSIDKSTGVATAIGDTGISVMMDLAFDTSGTLYGTVGNRIWTIDTSNGASTFVANLTGITSGSVMGIMFDAADNLYATAYVTNSPLYLVNTSTWSATSVGSTGFNFPHGGDIFDTDGDGYGDCVDCNPLSDMSATIIIGDCDTGVANAVLDGGCTMADEIAAAAADAKNHGAFVSAVAALTNAWNKAGLITGKEKGKIQSCAADSDIGK